MTRIEQRMIEWIDRHKLWLFAGIISIVAAILRFNGLDMESGDYTAWLGPWFYEIKDNGGLAAISQQVGDYNVLYQLLIALMTYFPFYPLKMYKALSILFDYLLAGTAAAIVKRMCGRTDNFRAVLTYAAVLLMPTVFIDSAWWAQCDSIYVTFILLALLELMKKREILGFVFLGIAFQFKLQTVFVFPFLIYYYMGSKRISLLHFLLIPAVGVVICLLCGRAPFETFEIYVNQAQYYPGMYNSNPSIWVLISRHDELFRLAALMLTIALLGVGLLITMQRKCIFDMRSGYPWLVWTVWTCMLFLPALHERYAYLLGILLVMAAAMNPRLIGYVALFEVTVVISYVRFLWKDTVPARIPETVTSAVFLIGYVAFTYQNLITDNYWYIKNEKN